MHKNASRFTCLKTSTGGLLKIQKDLQKRKKKKSPLFLDTKQLLNPHPHPRPLYEQICILQIPSPSLQKIETKSPIVAACI
jgi:hypothetical protein